MFSTKRKTQKIEIKIDLKKIKTSDSKQEEPSTEKSDTKEKTSYQSIFKNFKKGDLLFGFKMFYRKTICEKLTKKKIPYLLANQLNNPVVRIVVEGLNPKDYNLTPQQQKHFDFLKQKKAYLARSGGRTLSSMQHDPKIGAAIRRACKELVRNANPDQQIHFELDQVDVERLCQNSPTDVGVTNSELKALFRLFIAGKENPHVFFYQQGKPCQAPWKEDKNRKFWEGYQKNREEKHKLKLQK